MVADLEYCVDAAAGDPVVCVAPSLSSEEEKPTFDKLYRAVYADNLVSPEDSGAEGTCCLQTDNEALARLPGYVGYEFGPADGEGLL